MPVRRRKQVENTHLMFGTLGSDLSFGHHVTSSLSDSLTHSPHPIVSTEHLTRSLLRWVRFIKGKNARDTNKRTGSRHQSECCFLSTMKVQNSQSGSPFHHIDLHVLINSSPVKPKVQQKRNDRKKYSSECFVSCSSPPR